MKMCISTVGQNKKVNAFHLRGENKEFLEAYTPGCKGTMRHKT